MKTTPSKTGMMLAEFENPAQLLGAAQKLHDAGYKQFDCHSPFPIHGMDQAMGLKRSPLGYIVFVVAMLGLLGGITLEWWTSTIDYPLVISGKPFFSLPGLWAGGICHYGIIRRIYISFRHAGP